MKPAALLAGLREDLAERTQNPSAPSPVASTGARKPRPESRAARPTTLLALAITIDHRDEFFAAVGAHPDQHQQALPRSSRRTLTWMPSAQIYT